MRQRGLRKARNLQRWAALVAPLARRLAFANREGVIDRIPIPPANKPA
jgi:hypothetical protein